jgi:hypothetical protein
MNVFISANAELGINKTSRKEINTIRIRIDFIDMHPFGKGYYPIYHAK